ncbi:MAG: hypothetical protein M0Q24_07280 [Sulfurimonas sp.]|uniref:hypothetical protein n=1 Tax=Sulfurimonas sp. TaxID=2022749 RepID=UPI0025D41FB7|nr:hypothetical protein [Sulfurimonas sp.]MCK9491876.1 hypothetical protein [Sulfurimonas sp.]
MKYLVTLLFFTSLLLAKQDFTIQPAGIIQLRYDAHHIDYTSLGQQVLKEKEITYNDYIVGGTLGVQASWEGFTLNTLAYGVGRLHSKDENNLKNVKSFYNNDLDGFLYVGELSIKKSFDAHSVTIGRQTYDTPLVNKNFRITQNAYEGLNYSYANGAFNFKSLYFYKIASSTMANNVPFNHKYGFLGYGLGYNSGGYTTLSKHIINKDLATNGAIHFLAKYGEKEQHLSFENLFVDNFFNTLNLTLSYNIENFYIKTGMIYQFSVGDKHIEKHIEPAQFGKKLESYHYQLELKYKNEKVQIAYSIASTPSNKNAIYNGTLMSPFSNQASWLVGLNTSHSTIADTLSQKISLLTHTKFYKIPIVFSTAYIRYDIGKNNNLTANAIDTSELYLHLQGYFSKNISAKIQYSYVQNYDPLRYKSFNTKLALEYKF